MNQNITTIINNNNCKRPECGSTLLESRAAFAQSQSEMANAETTIVIVANNRIAKTKRCIQSVLDNTKDQDYNLILIDSGSSDGTLEYFESVPCEKKKVIRINKNIGGMFPFMCLDMMDIGEYLLFLANDIVVTPNWLKNLLLCIKSDPKIGMVVPMSTNSSNYQGVSLSFNSDRELMNIAASFNKSNPKKWQERLRLITLAPIFRKEALIAIGFPLFDPAFYHDFADDDVTFRIRRMGYRAILAGDTFVHHNHDYRNGEDKDQKEFEKSLEMGKKDFREKYFGIDAWDDVNNYYLDILPALPTPSVNCKVPAVLGIDVKCGTPILDIKNHLKSCGVENINAYAFTQEAKYNLDLMSVCGPQVFCDREEYLRDYFLQNYFDYIVIGKAVNTYHEPQKVINDSLSFLKKGGKLILTLSNTLGFREFLNICGKRDVYNPSFAYNITPEALQSSLELFGGKVIFCKARPEALSENDRGILGQLLQNNCSKSDFSACLDRLCTGEFIFGIEKQNKG